MRNIILFIACLIVVSFIFILISCTSNTPKPNQVISYLADATEPSFIHLKLEELQQISLIPTVSEMKDEGASESLRIVPITEFSLNPLVQVSIQPVVNTWLSNEIDRKRNVEIYWSSINEALKSVASIRAKRNGSAIYASVVRELSYVTSSSATHKIIIINSDLMENSSVANLYDSKSFTMLQRNSELMQKLFEAKHTLPSLENVHVFLVYQPQTILESRQFEITSAFYSKLLSSKGAHVTITATLSKHN